MTLSFKPIVPKIALSVPGAERAMAESLRGFAADFKLQMAEYPGEMPWRSRVPKSGPRANGARTGRYGRGWQNARTTYTKYSVRITNSVPYAAVVGGSRSRRPGQAITLAERGWQSVDDVGPEVMARHLPNFSKYAVTGEEI